MSSRSRRWGGLLSAVPLVAVLGGPVLAAPGEGEGARLRLGDVSCTGTYRMSASPAIQSVVLAGERDTTFTGTFDLDACESVKHPKITSGRMSLKATGQAACDITHADVYVKDGTGRGDITWNTGERSTFSAATWKGKTGALSLSDGTIADGLMKGGRLDLTAVPDTGIVSLSYGCSVPGVSRLDGSVRTADISAP
ncbi:hypothetical protein EDD29_3405 [Actinocorallia herbida]|uniref:Uncharacterized protein n=1 Tax=Actinocorallia herbida TaxID=58109 RepID=A0A3N1CX60_9ACTN|nr:hypothetical protein [Actinocorallia herbida]ROO85854.1 hypothetical protein EDD29_3405 [Actinocorallia herbida]